jgi:two-component system response regulator HydG
MKNNLFKILIVDDEPEHREVLDIILSSKGYQTKTCAGGKEALEILKETHFDLVLTDFIMPEMDGMELLKQIKDSYKDVEVIVITGYGTIQNAVEAMKKGAFSYVIKGSAPEEMLDEIEKLFKVKTLGKDNQVLRKEEENEKEEENSDFMLRSNSPVFQKVLSIAKKSAVANVNVLILGESGVGKEIVARYIHQCSDRKDKCFLAVNCHTLPENLLESELFGYEKGAFTGAIESRKGKFEAAHGGTLFLDEVGDISLSTQVKLLRVIETKKIERIGSNRVIDLDFRLISATNRNLVQEIRKENFREDFFYRLSTIVIEVPPLRKRREDLKMFIDFFIKKSEIEMKKKIEFIEPEVMQFLMNYDYPGNIRELRNIIERLVVLSEEGKICKNNLPEVQKIDHSFIDFDSIRPLKEIRKEFEAKYIEQVLEQCEYNLSEAAKKMDISRRQLFNKTKEYGIKY